MADRLILLYGPSGAGKTGSAIALAKLRYEATGLTTRVYVGDGSLANYLDSGLVEAGILEVFDYSNIPWPMTVSNRICEGWWPNEKGELVAPTPDVFKRVGFWIYEAMSTMVRDYIMGNIKGGLAWQAALGVKIGESSPYRIMDAEVAQIDVKGNATYKDKTGTGEAFGGNPMAHFGTAQTHAMGLIRRTAALPGWVVWTSHEKLGKEEIKDRKTDTTTATGDVVIGPEVAGGALSATISKKFNDTLHFTVARKVVSGVQDTQTTKSTKEAQDQYRLYFRDHFDPDGVVQVPYRAVVRCDKPALLPKEGYFSGAPGEAILKLYAKLAEAKAQQLAEAAALKAKVEQKLKEGVAA